MEAAVRQKALRMLTYGLYVMTSGQGEDLAAGTVNWLSQVSLRPPLVMAGVKRGSSLHKAIERSGVFAVNILDRTQKEIARTFFKTARPKENKLSGYAFERGKTGAPLLLDVPAFFECRVLDRLTRGDHTIFVGEVVNAGVRHEATPLLLRETGFSYGG